MQTVKDLTIEESKAIVGEVIEEKLREFLTDPDGGPTLRIEVQDRLRKELQEPHPESENIPLLET